MEVAKSFKRKSVVFLIDLLLKKNAQKNADIILKLCIVIGRVLTYLRLHFFTPRSLWGTTPIITIIGNSLCDTLLNFKSDTVVFTTYRTTQNFSYNLDWMAQDAILSKYYDSKPLLKLILAWALIRYDFFNYFHDRGFFKIEDSERGLNEEELKILRKANKRLYCYAYGSDVRTKKITMALGQWNFCIRCPNPGICCVCDDNVGLANAKKAAQYANGVVSTGDVLNYTVNHHNIHYLAVDMSKFPFAKEIENKISNRVLKVLHSPNHDYFKGTWMLEESIQYLQKQDIQIELIRTHGISNMEVLALMRTVDVVADQFIGGMYGYTTLEAMALGKPVLCYIREENLLLEPELCPIIRTSPETLTAKLLWCINHREELLELGKKSRKYVESYHSTPAVALRLSRLYLKTGNLPRRLANKLAASTQNLKKMNSLP